MAYIPLSDVVTAIVITVDATKLVPEYRRTTIVHCGSALSITAYEAVTISYKNSYRNSAQPPSDRIQLN